MVNQNCILIATLGSEPQVITLALDNLFAQGEPISRVVVLHTSGDNPAIRQALADLQDEMTKYAGYRQRGVQFEVQPFLRDRKPLTDIITDDDARVVLRVLVQQITAYKDRGARIHLLPAGGRKAMAMYAMLAAQILFEEQDRLWLLFSADPLRIARMLHAPPGETTLVEMPIIPWRLGLREKQAFLRVSLTPTEAEVLELVARQNLSNAEIADQRFTAAKTVDHQLSAIYAKLHAFLGYRDDVRIDRRTLIAEFKAFYDVQDALSLTSPESEATLFQDAPEAGAPPVEHEM